MLPDLAAFNVTYGTVVCDMFHLMCLMMFLIRSSNVPVFFFLSSDKPAAYFGQREDERVPLLSQRLGGRHRQTRL